MRYDNRKIQHYKAKVGTMMSTLRSSDLPFERIEQIIDYSSPVDAELDFGALSTSNVLKYVLDDRSWIAVRPSGMEPKIKIYYGIKDVDRDTAEQRLQIIQNTIKTKLGLN